jgi:hypothetical protein
MSPCEGKHAPVRPGPWTADQCRVCWLYAYDPAYRALWDAAGPAPRRTGPCVHRGPEVRQEECPTCRGRVRLKVFACGLHGECTVARPLAGTACCATCPDYEE